MIIKGNPAGNVGFWTKHLMNDVTNERAEVTEIRGLLAEDLRGALREMQAVATGSRSHGNFMYSASISPRRDERLTPEQWVEAIDTLEKNLGLADHQRVVIEHVKDGRQHYHVVWNRVDVDTMRVADMGGNYHVHEDTARELERRFGHERTQSSDREHPRREELWEKRAAERSGIDPKQMKAELSELWRQSDSGHAFKSAVEERGYVLAQGDRRDFVVIDRAGDAHSLARRLDGVNTKDVREKMADLDRDALPAVKEVRAEQWAERAERAQANRQAGAAQKADNETLRNVDNKQFWADYRDRKDTAAATRTEAWKERAESERDRVDNPRVGDQLARAPLKVFDAATGVTDTLLNFLARGPTQKSVPDPPKTPYAAQLESINAGRRSLAALERIKEDVAKGRDLQASDVYGLTPTLIEQIKSKGDAHLLGIVESMEWNRSRDHDYGRTRER